MPKGVKGFQKGHKKTGGRKKGTPNKFTTLKDAFVEAFRDLGAARGLIKWVRKSNENQKVFYSLVARMLPTEMRIDAPAPIIHVLSGVPRPGPDDLAGDRKSPEEMTDEELNAEIKKLEARRAPARKKSTAAAARKGKKKKA
jgi:hypothetical protein